MIFDNMIFNEKKNFLLFFCLVRLLKERIDQNAKRKVRAMVGSVRERERERDNDAIGKKDARDTTEQIIAIVDVFVP
jgi:hypothetical protein